VCLLWLCALSTSTIEIGIFWCSWFSADDVATYDPVNFASDCKAFQYDLDSVSIWWFKWQMRLNVSKCELLCTSNKHSPVQPVYYINNHPFQWVSSVWSTWVLWWTLSYPGMNIFLTFSLKHLKFLNISRRHMFTSHVSSKYKAFRALVLPILDYASTV